MSIFRSGALTFLVRLGLLFAIEALLDPEVAVILDYWIMLERFADYSFLVLLLLLFGGSMATSAVLSVVFFSRDIIFANLGNLFNYCC